VSEPKAKTFEELKAEREREWQAAQAKAAAALRAQQAQLQAMPDVATPPDPSIPWGHPGVACRKCRSAGFRVTRWVTCNGVRHRAELVCLGCTWRDTWDFTLKRWLRQIPSEEK